MSLTQQSRQVAKRLITTQFLVTILVSLGFLLNGIQAGYSAFIGGMICVVPNAVFAIYATRFGGARAAKQIARSFYLGETLKIVLTVILFTLVFKLLTLNVGALFISYALTLLVYWFSPLLMRNVSSN